MQQILLHDKKFTRLGRFLYDLISHPSNYAEVLSKHATTQNILSLYPTFYYYTLLKTKTGLLNFSQYWSGQRGPMCLFAAQCNVGQSKMCTFFVLLVVCLCI